MAGHIVLTMSACLVLAHATSGVRLTPHLSPILPSPCPFPPSRPLFLVITVVQNSLTPAGSARSASNCRYARRYALLRRQHSICAASVGPRSPLLLQTSKMSDLVLADSVGRDVVADQVAAAEDLADLVETVRLEALLVSFLRQW